MLNLFQEASCGSAMIAKPRVFATFGSRGGQHLDDWRQGETANAAANLY